MQFGKTKIIATCLLAVGCFSLLMMMGCSRTIKFAYPGSDAVVPTNDIKVQIGEFENKTGFKNPKRIGSKVRFDIPVSKAVQEAVAAELQQAGYLVDKSEHEISGSIHSVVFGKQARGITGKYSEGTSLTFCIKRVLDEKVIYRRVFNEPIKNTRSGRTYIYYKDVKSQIDNLKRCVLQFINDKNVKLALISDRKKGSSLVKAEKPTTITTAAPVTQAQENPISGTRWAVIIGVSDYHDSRIPALRYADGDAKALYDWLVSPKGGRYSPTRVKLLLNEQATTQNMRDVLFSWLKQALAEDMITIYFSGHGSPDSPDTPDNLFLLPYDADYEKIGATAFPMWDIETALKRFIKAKKVVIIADACHAGGVGAEFDISHKGVEINPQINSGLQDLAKIGDGIAVFTASDNKQLSQESKKWGGGHGVFTWFLLKGLQGEADYTKDGQVTLGELIPYISEQVRRETKNAQSPTIAGKFDPSLSIAK